MALSAGVRGVVPWLQLRQSVATELFGQGGGTPGGRATFMRALGLGHVRPRCLLVKGLKTLLLDVSPR
jgi:hypothetical protein